MPSSTDFGTRSGPASPVRTGKHEDFFASGSGSATSCSTESCGSVCRMRKRVGNPAGFTPAGCPEGTAMKRSMTMKLFGAAVLGLAGAGCVGAADGVDDHLAGAAGRDPTPLNMLGVSRRFGPPGPVTIWQKLGLGKQQWKLCRRTCATPRRPLMAGIVAPSAGSPADSSRRSAPPFRLPANSSTRAPSAPTRRSRRTSSTPRGGRKPSKSWPASIATTGPKPRKP